MADLPLGDWLADCLRTHQRSAGAFEPSRRSTASAGYDSIITSNNVKTVHARVGDLTTIPLRKATRDRLRELGRKGETYDRLLTRLMDGHEERLVDFEAVAE